LIANNSLPVWGGNGLNHYFFDFLPRNEKFNLVIVFLDIVAIAAIIEGKLKELLGLFALLMTPVILIEIIKPFLYPLVLIGLLILFVRLVDK